MLERDQRWMSNEDLLTLDVTPEEFSAQRVMEHLAWTQEPHIWNHPLTQEFLKQELCTYSLEFQKFLNWMRTRPRLSPFRVEWSLFDADWQVAGQIDSVWIDLDTKKQYVIVDWKRVREQLTDDVCEMQKQSFGRRGFDCCDDLFDTPYNHYCLQQNLYAHLLEKNYGIKVGAMFLVQCHPQINEDTLFHEVSVRRDPSRCDAMVGLLKTNNIVTTFFLSSDWKRVREQLTDDLCERQEQSFGRRGFD